MVEEEVESGENLDNFNELPYKNLEDEYDRIPYSYRDPNTINIIEKAKEKETVDPTPE